MLSTPVPALVPAPRLDATTKVGFGLVVLILSLGLGWMIATPPGIFSDSVSGFLVMRSMERGAPFNHEWMVDADNIEFDQSEFKSWWTPGQYLVPMAFTLLGFDLGNSLRATVALAWLAGAIGFWLLWRRLGFSPALSAASVAVLISQPYVLQWGRFYHGGALLEWCFVPWFTLLALRVRAHALWEVPALACALTMGIFFKSSFVIVGGSILAGLLWLRARESGAFDKATIAAATRTAGAMGIALLGFWLYTSLGRSPAGQKPWAFTGIDLRELFFAAAAPVLTLFDAWVAFIPNTESVQWSFTGIGPALAAASLVGGALVLVVVRFSGASRQYTSLLVGVYVGTIVAYLLAWTLDLLISFNVRHFRVAGLFLIPGALLLLARLPGRFGRWAPVVVTAVACLVSALRFTFPSQGDPLGRPIGAAGFSHIYASQSALDALAELDQSLGYGNHLIGVPWPQMALDLQRSRVYDMRTGLYGATSYHQKVFFGEVDNLIVLIPSEEEAAIPGLLRAFRQHRDWRRIRTDVEDFVFMYSGEREDLR